MGCNPALSRTCVCQPAPNSTLPARTRKPGASSEERSTPTILALTLRLSTLMVPEKPFSDTVKETIVAIVVFLLSSPAASIAASMAVGLAIGPYATRGRSGGRSLPRLSCLARSGRIADRGRTRRPGRPPHTLYTSQTSRRRSPDATRSVREYGQLRHPDNNQHRQILRETLWTISATE